MLSTAPLLETSLDGLTLHRRGKVRDVYEVGDDLLIVATDRISAFDYVLGSGIPDKGKVLTQLSAFWFERMGDLVPHHLLVDSTSTRSRPRARRTPTSLRGRSMLVRRTEPVPIECVARGYLSGSGWKEYQQTGSVCGVDAAGRACANPIGCPSRSSRRRPRPRAATTSTSARTRPAGSSAPSSIARLKALTLEIYRARRRARRVEGHHHRRHEVRVRLGRRRRPGDRRRPHRRSADARLVALLAAATQYEPGHGQPSFDKQFVRDYLEEIRWNKQPPVPSLPDDVVAARARSTSRLPPACPAASCSSAVRDQLETLVQEMLDKGMLYDDARREFEKMFITRALQRSKGSVGDAAELLGLHRNTVARKMTEYRIKRATSSVRVRRLSEPRELG